jgi:hypothetical protein
MKYQILFVSNSETTQFANGYEKIGVIECSEEEAKQYIQNKLKAFYEEEGWAVPKIKWYTWERCNRTECFCEEAYQITGYAYEPNDDAIPIGKIWGNESLWGDDDYEEEE